MFSFDTSLLGCIGDLYRRPLLSGDAADAVVAEMVVKPVFIAHLAQFSCYPSCFVLCTRGPQFLRASADNGVDKAYGQ